MHHHNHQSSSSDNIHYQQWDHMAAAMHNPMNRRRSEMSSPGRRDSTGSLTRRGSLFSVSFLDFPLTPRMGESSTVFGMPPSSNEADPFAPLSFSEPLPMLSPTVLSRPTTDRLLGDKSEASIPSVISASSSYSSHCAVSHSNGGMQMPPMLPLSMSTGMRRMSMNPMDYFPRHNPITPIHSMSPKQKLQHGSATLSSMLTPMKSLSSGGGSEAGGGGGGGGCYDGMDDDGDDNESTQQRFKPFHEEKWSQRFKELLQFHKDHGHSAVPHTYPPNPQLARWVKRQRRQYKLRKDNRQSTMTTERLDLLSSVGFIWDSHDVNWREKLDTLMVYRNEHGHCNVPSNYRDKKLATWVKCQRRQYKLYWDGKPSAMSPERILELEKVGFEWEIRSTIARNNSNNGGSNNGNTTATTASASAAQQAKMIAQEALEVCSSDGPVVDCSGSDHQEYRRYKDCDDTGLMAVGHHHHQGHHHHTHHHHAVGGTEDQSSTGADDASSVMAPLLHHHQMRYGNLPTMPTNISEL